LRNTIKAWTGLSESKLMTYNGTLFYEDTVKEANLPQKSVGMRQYEDSNNRMSDSEKFQVPKKGQYDFKRIPLGDPRVWSLFARGDSLGIFQLEKQLGQDWSKRAKPRNIEELAALVSILRPGPLESGMSDQYVKRKSGEEPIEYLHPLLEPILKETYGCLIYQEQAMRIAVELFGLNLVEADTLRKAIGKKLPEVMAKAKKTCMEKAVAFGKVTQEEADEIFGWIEKSVRYSFNKSHAVSYAMHAYYCAYQKVHFPKEFYTAWLTYSDWKPDQKEEVYNLVQNARMNGITIIPPDVRRMNVDFEVLPNEHIIFGLSHIRGVGATAIKTLQEYKGNLNTLMGFIKSIKKLHRNVAESLVKAGACDCYGISRSGLLKMIHIILGRSDNKGPDEPPEVKELTPIEYRHFIAKIDELGIEGSLYSIVNEEICVKKRIPTIEAKIKYIKELPKDTARQKSIWETLYLGLNLTCSAADDYSKLDKNAKTCKEAYKLHSKDKVVLHVVIDGIKPRKTKKGDNYCYMNVSDNTGAISGLVCWPQQYEEFKNDLIEGAVVEIYGKKESWNGKDQVIINDVKFIG
jgi:DNA polymerase-3 subunit alpha